VNQHWRCAVVDPATGAVCTLRPHDEGDEHKGLAAVQGTGRSTKVVSWTGVRSGRWSSTPTVGLGCLAATSRFELSPIVPWLCATGTEAKDLVFR
jgi:hypothetical protein